MKIVRLKNSVKIELETNEEVKNLENICDHYSESDDFTEGDDDDGLREIHNQAAILGSQLSFKTYKLKK